MTICPMRDSVLGRTKKANCFFLFIQFNFIINDQEHEIRCECEA